MQGERVVAYLVIEIPEGEKHQVLIARPLPTVQDSRQFV